MNHFSFIPTDEGEARAWAWLMMLQRIAWQSHSPQAVRDQVLVRLVPGVLGASRNAPGVEVLVSYPAMEGRARGTGNSLLEAVVRLHSDLWNKGVRLPWPNIPHEPETWRWPLPHLPER